MKRKFPLHWQILIGLVCGLLYGGGVSLFAEETEQFKVFTSNWIHPWGEIFVNSLKLIAVPLVLFSLVNGIASLSNIAKLGKMGGKTIGMYLLTTVIAVSCGLIIVNLFKPWEAISLETAKEIIQSYTDKAGENISNAETVKKHGPLQFLVNLVPKNVFDAATKNENMLQVIFFAVLFGVALLSINKEKASPVKRFFEGTNEVILKIVDYLMYLAPLGTFALIANVFVQNSENFGELIVAIGEYSFTVIIALLIVITISVVLAYFFGKKKPIDFLKGIAPAQLLAFSTRSSAAALPVNMECVKNKVGVDKEVTSFVLPLGATINMDGTSCYQAVAAVFIANVYQMDLGLMDQLSIVLTATLASIGSAAVPGAGMVMLAIVLGQLGVPMVGIALIIGVDTLLDMCRTVVNVTGDAMVATVIGSKFKNKLDE